MALRNKIVFALVITAISISACLPMLYFKFYKQRITNPFRIDGFGAQFQTIIYTAIYAELNNMKFLYTPFIAMEHNYDNDQLFLDKKEELINLINNVATSANHENVISLSRADYIKYFEDNIQQCCNTKALQTIKELFRANKPNNYFNNNKINIAMHVRRPNQHDSRLEGADVPTKQFLQVLASLKQEYKDQEYLVHIYSQGVPKDFKDFVGPNVVLHLNESVEDTFTGMVLADVLVTSPSSFSYTAGLISNGKVYYMPFWHPPLPGWKVI